MEDQAIRWHTAPTLYKQMDEGMHPPFPKNGNLRLAKNYRGITLTSIATKIYNALLHNRIEPKIKKILRKNQNGFRSNISTTSLILTIHRILKSVHAKNLEATILFVDFANSSGTIWPIAGRIRGFHTFPKGIWHRYILQWGPCMNIRLLCGWCKNT